MTQMSDVLDDDVHTAYTQVRAAVSLRISKVRGVRRRAKWMSNGLKGAAFALLLVGIIFPVASALFEIKIDPIFGVNLLATGYFAIALGGLCTLTDQVFSLSQKYDRLLTFELRLEAMLRDFDANWKLRNVSSAKAGVARKVAHFQLLYDFMKALDDAKRTEVEERIAERRAGSEVLAQRLAAAPSRTKGGS